MNNVDKFSNVLTAVRDFADRAHGVQIRRYSGERYIVHPIRVLETCSAYTQDITILCACLLHDVLEDTSVSEHEMRDFLLHHLSEEHVDRIIRLVVELTDIYTPERFPVLNRRMRKKREVARLAHISADAQLIKYADIIDNATNIFIHDPDFANVYLQEGKALLVKMSKGDSGLYTRALKTVSDCLELLESKEAI